MRFSSQVNVAPMSGHVLGYDMAALLSIATHLQYDIFALTELLPALEWGMVEGLRVGRDGEDG